MKGKLGSVLLLVLLTYFPLSGQHWADLMADPETNFYEVQQAFEDYWKDKDHTQKGKGWKPYKRWEWFTEQRVYPHGDRLQMGKALQAYYLEHKDDPSRSSGGNWNFLGPTNVPTNRGGAGRANFVRIDPHDPNILWAGSPGGGLWKSVNNGQGWTNWNTDLLPVIGCTDLAVDPVNPNILYLATGDGYANDTYSIGVLKSQDGGLTWETTGMEWTVNQQRVIRKLLIHPNNTNILFAATNNGIFRSLDAGASWFAVRNGNFYDIEFKPGDPNVLYAGSRQFFRSVDGGQNWEAMLDGTPSGAVVQRMALAVSPANPEAVYILAARQGDNGFEGVYRSNDSGQTFTQQSSSPNLLGWSSSGNDSGGQGWFTLSIAASPVDADRIVVGGVNVWRSNNAGVDWSIVGHWWGDQAPYVHADIHDLIFLDGSHDTYIAGTDGGVFRTVNDGVSWSDLSDGLEVAQIYRLGTSATNPGRVITGWQDNGSNLLNNSSWRRVLGGDGMECIIDYTNANVMYGEYYYGYIEKSQNGGNNWVTIVSSGESSGVNSNGLWVTPYIMHPTNNQTLLVGKDQLYRTTNGGFDWDQLGNVGGGGLIRAIAYAPSDPSVIYVARTNTLHVSTNGGASFTNISNGLPNQTITYIAVSDQDPQRVYVSYSGYVQGNKVFLSGNGGQSWSNFSAGLPNLPVNCLVVHNGTNNGLYAGTDVGVYYRNNDLNGWIPFSAGLPNVIVNELEIQYSSGKLRAATYGRGLWESDLKDGAPELPIADFQVTTNATCVGTPINFTDKTENIPTSWSWTFEGGTPEQSTAKNPEVIWNQPGTYTVTLTASNTAGSHTVERQVTIRPLPEVQVNPAEPVVCAGESVVLTASGASGYFWSNNLGAGSTKTVKPAATQTYTVTGSVQGCTNVASVTVTVAPLPQVELSTSKDTLCPGESLQLDASGAATYVWNEGAFEGESWVFVAEASGLVQVVGLSSEGCRGEAEVFLTVRSAPEVQIQASATQICPGEPVTLAASGAQTYLWSNALGDQAQVVLQPEESVVVELTGTDEFGCSGQALVTIEVVQLPELQITADKAAVCPGTTVILTASGADTYLWGEDGSTENKLTVQPQASGTYSVTGFNVLGCAVEAEIEIEVVVLDVQIVSWPDMECASGLYRLIPGEGVQIQTYTGSSGVVLDKTLDPYFFQVLTAPSSAELLVILARDNAICLQNLPLPVSEGQTAPLMYDRCREALEASAGCTPGKGQWYRVNRKDGEVTPLEGQRDVTLSGVKPQWFVDFAFIYTCAEPCSHPVQVAAWNPDQVPTCNSSFLVELSPNPTSDQLRITVIQPGGDWLELQVWDPIGRLLHEQRISHDGGLVQTALTVHQWAAGNYLLRLKSANGQERVLRFVVQ